MKYILYLTMGYLEFCSNCGKKNTFGQKDGNQRYYCIYCNTIHYENPKPTATLICPNEDQLLLVQRAVDPGKGKWGLPGGFMEKGETPEISAKRELLEETNLIGEASSLIGTCCHYNTIFGDILLLGIEMKIFNWKEMKAGDDAAAAALFQINSLPKLAFTCHEEIVTMYCDQKRI